MLGLCVSDAGRVCLRRRAVETESHQTGRDAAGDYALGFGRFEPAAAVRVGGARRGPFGLFIIRGPSYKGKPTRVFAYYASPVTLGVKGAAKKHFPGVVLIHGGGGTAFKEWAELWAQRGYAAIAMDLAGCGPDGKPLARRRARARTTT